MNCYFEALEVLDKLYDKDTVIPPATVNGGKANLRFVNAYYKDKAFFITTYALSNKIQEICTNPSVAIAHNLFVAHGEAENMGHPLDIKIKLCGKNFGVYFAYFTTNMLMRMTQTPVY